MMYSILALFLLFVGYSSALHSAVCDSGFINLISPCVRNDAINIDVLAVLDVPALAWNVTTNHLCKNSTARGIFRFTPEAGSTIDSAFVQWGDGGSDMIAPLFPCGLLPGALGALPHPPNAICGTANHTYAKNGEFPVGVFGVNDDGIESQREGVVTIHRCTPSVDIDLIRIVRFNTSNRNINQCTPPDAYVRATHDSDVYPITKAFGFEFPGLAIVWWGDMSGQMFSFFPINGALYVVNHPNTYFPSSGEFPVGIFAGTNEEQKQLEVFVTVDACPI